MANEPTTEASNPPSKATSCGSYPATVCSAPLGPKHKGMRMYATGLLKNAAAWLPKDRTGERWMLEQLSEHLTELGRRFYAGDVLVVDEFLQLYALDDDRQNEALHRQPAAKGDGESCV